MSNTLYSPHWYRVAKLKPKLHNHVEIHRHDYRGLIWYILEDPVTGRHHRFNPAAYQFIGLLNGILSVEEIANELHRKLGDFAPGQQEIIQLIGQLHDADLIQSDVLVDTEELFERQARIAKSKFNQSFTNPLSQKLPLWDPDEFLSRHQNKVRWLLGGWMAAVWLVVVMIAGLEAFTNWSQITAHFEINALSPYNFLILFFLYIPIKILHELGHAFATKLKGGEVHEMGVNFLMFMPVPYVDVSNSASFRSKYDRILVSAAGILVECFLAALGLSLFLITEPGLLRDIGFNIMLTGGISSLFFNGNPLLKYDGYFILADVLGIPNLYQRSAHYWRYFFQRHLFGMAQTNSPAMASGETVWFVIYSIISQLYRFGILWFVCVHVTDKFFFFGVLLAFWLAGIQIVWPLFKAIRFVFHSPQLQSNRSRAVMASAGIILGAIIVFGIFPIPSYTMAEGVLWLPEESQIKAEQSGFIASVQAKSGQWVEKGYTLLTMYDDELMSKAKIARGKLNELQSQYRSEKESDLVKANIIKQEIGIARSELDHLDKRAQALTLTAVKKGQVMLLEDNDLTGRYVKQGELIGYLLDGKPTTVRMVISQENIGQFRERTDDIKIRFANKVSHAYNASVIRETPEATDKLPSLALATVGGGKIPVDPKHEQAMIALQKSFLVDVKFVPSEQNIPIGTRAYVRINHGGEPLSKQWYRRIRQAFLRQFHV